MTLYTTTIDSPVGTLRLVATDDALMAVLWPEERAGRVRFDSEPQATAGRPILDRLGEDLKQVTVVVAINQDAQLLELVDRLVDLSDTSF